MRWLVLATGFVLLAIFGKAAFVSEANVKLSQGTLVVFLGVSAVVFFLLFLKTSRGTTDFEQWLDANSDLILEKGALYRGDVITPSTELRYFVLTVSVIFMTFKGPSGSYLAKADKFRVAQFAYTLGSLLLGWWGLPWGPVYTIQAVSTNLSGGYQSTVGAHLTNIARRRVVGKDHALLLLTRAIGAAFFGTLFAFVGGALVGAVASETWTTYLGASLIGTLAAAWTWKYGKVWIR